MSNIAVSSKYVEEGIECFFGFKLTSLKAKAQSAAPEDQIQAHHLALSRFINLLYDPNRDITYCLRYLIKPDLQFFSMGRIEIALLIKIVLNKSGSNPTSEVAQLAGVLKPLLGSSFREYFWKQIDDDTELQEFLNPFDWEKGHFAEIRRREENIFLESLIPQRQLGFMSADNKVSGETSRAISYVHPYVTPLSGFSRILKALLQGSSISVLTTLLKPTVLSENEKDFLSSQISYCEGSTKDADSAMRIQKNRADILSHTLLSQYLTLQDAPFYLTFTVASETLLDRITLEMIGLGITEPIGQVGNASNYTLHYGGYDVEVPQSQSEQAILIKNMRSLSQGPWPEGPIGKDSPRLRYLFDGKEAVSAFNLPINIEDNLPGINTHFIEEQALPREMLEPLKKPKGSILIGHNHFLGFEQKLMISESTRRQHTYIIGQTGTGKTTLMKTMILSDMNAGNGLAVIDPHGELYDDLLALIPESRKDDVVLLNPSDTQYPVGFNLLQVKHDDEREAVIKEFRAILKRYVFEYYAITDGAYAGPVFFQHIQNNLLLASSDINNPGTILEANNIFLKPEYYKRWLPLKWQNHILQEWVTNSLPTINYQARMNDGGMFSDYFAGKLTDFTNDSRVSLFFGQPYSTINIADIIENKKILLINLSKGLLGEANASLLGMILMAKFSTAFMERRKYLEEGKKLTPFYLYVDEFQNIATENFSILLSEARKFGLGLILANQFISQVREKNIREAIFGNVGTLISFRLGIDDAYIMESQFLPHFNSQDICNLPNYNAIIRTNIEGKRTMPCSFQTILPEYSEHYCDKKEVIALSRNKYGIPRNLAEYLVEISLAPERLSKSEFFFEKEETLPSEMLLNNDLALPLSVLCQSPKGFHFIMENLYDRIKAQIIHHLYYEKFIPADEVALILNRMNQKTSEEFHADKFGFLTYAAGGNSDYLHSFIGIANGIIRQILIKRIEVLSQMLKNEKEDPLVLKIMELFTEEKWRSCFSEIGLNVASLSISQSYQDIFGSD